MADIRQQHEWRALQCADTAFSVATGADEVAKSADAFNADLLTTSANVDI